MDRFIILFLIFAFSIILIKILLKSENLFFSISFLCKFYIFTLFKEREMKDRWIGG